MPSATIEINRLKVYAYHGVGDQETKVGNDFEVSVHLEYPCDYAMKTDRLGFTLSYADVLDVVIKEMRKPIECSLVRRAEHEELVAGEKT